MGLHRNDESETCAYCAHWITDRARKMPDDLFAPCMSQKQDTEAGDSCNQFIPSKPGDAPACTHVDRTNIKYQGGHIDVFLCLSCGYLVATIGTLEIKRRVYETGPMESFFIDKIFELASRSAEWKVP